MVDRKLKVVKGREGRQEIEGAEGKDGRQEIKGGEGERR